MLIAIALFTPFQDMKIDRDGTLLIRLGSLFSGFLGVGGCGAALLDSSSNRSPTTWASVRGYSLLGFL